MKKCIWCLIDLTNQHNLQHTLHKFQTQLHNSSCSTKNSQEMKNSCFDSKCRLQMLFWLLKYQQNQMTLNNSIHSSNKNPSRQDSVPSLHPLSLPTQHHKKHPDCRTHSPHNSERSGSASLQKEALWSCKDSAFSTSSLSSDHCCSTQCRTRKTEASQSPPSSKPTTRTTFEALFQKKAPLRIGLEEEESWFRC